MVFAKNPDNELRNALVVTGIGIFSAVLAVIFVFSSDEFIVFQQVGLVLANLWWIILPVPMWLIFYMVHMEYMAVMWVIQQKNVLLEIRVPADVEKSPKLMKMVIIGLHDYTTLSKFEIYCGWRALQNKYTFEIVSTGGTIHFYVRCGEKSRNAVEAQIYAHYPDAEIFEVPDYTKEVPKYLPNSEWDVWGVTYGLVNKDAYPIRSYRHFIEDVTGKMIDPLASTIETMSTVPPGQHVWLQIIFYSAPSKEWVPEAQAEVNKLMRIPEKKQETFLGTLGGIFGNVISAFTGAPIAGAEEKKDEFNVQKIPLTDQEKVKAIMENISDIGYKVAMRFVYLGKKDGWNKALGVSGVLGALKQTSDEVYNSLRIENDTKTYAQYYFIEPRLRYRQRKIIQNYRDRDFAGTGFYFTSEELATVFHFPDMSVKSPSVNRVEAKKGDAPANLPVAFE